MSNYETTPPGGDAPITPQQMYDVLTDIAITNKAIRDQLSPEAAVASYHQEAARRDRYIARGNVEGLDDERVAASQQELERDRSEAVQRATYVARAGREAEQAIERFRSPTASPSERIQIMERAGFLTGGPTPESIRTVRGNIPATRIRQIFEAQEAGEQIVPSEENLINQLNADLLSHMTEQFAKEAPSRASKIMDAVEESGIRQLRYGQLPLQDILRSMGSLFGRPLQSRQQAALEAEERVRRAQALGVQADFGDMETFERLQASRRAGNVGPLARTRIGGLGLRGMAGAARFLPMAGQALAIGEVIGDTFQNQVMGRYQGAVAEGQVQGGGFREGVAARLRSFRVGLNPFDMITGEIANQIVTGVRQQGFSGRQGESIQDAVADTFKDLGTSIESTIQIYTEAVRLNGETVDHTREILENFDTTAQDLGLSVQEVANRFQQISGTVGALGAGAQTSNVANALLRATPAGVDAGTFGQIFERARGEIAASLGVAPNMVTAERYSQSAYGPALEQVLQRQQQIASRIVGDDPNMVATYLSQSSPYFQGLPVNQIQALLEQMNMGRGPSAQMNFGREGRRERAAEVAAGRRMGRRTIPMSQIQDRMRNVDRDDWREVMAREFGIQGQEYDRFVQAFKEQNGQGEWTVEGGRDQIPMQELLRIRNRSLDNLREDLTPEQIERFNRLKTNREFSVQSFIASVRRDDGKKSGPEVDLANNFGSVTIRLRPGMESKLFELAREREAETAKGNLARNRAPRP